MTDPAEPISQRNRLGSILLMIGFVSMTLMVFIRAMIEHDAFPYWDSDPFLFSLPITGLTPNLTLILNISVVGSCCLSLIGMMFRRDELPVITSLMVVLGIIVIGFHNYQQLDTSLDGSNLFAIMSVLFVTSFAHKVESIHKIMISLVVSFGIMLTIQGGYEMFVEHPLTVQNYELNRDSFLASRGWASDSFQTRSYERRLFQPEPIAWFGLTNVFASFVGAGAAGLLVLGWRLKSSSKLWSVIFLAGLISFAGLLLTQAKGGIGAFVLGMSIFVFAQLLKKFKIDGRATVVVSFLIIALVLLRGIIGERVGELSLLFRSQYIVGSFRMFIEHPLIGVGPGAFQENYAILKPALSPEDVASAHSVPFDLLAQLGIGGLACIWVLINTVWRARPQQSTCNESSTQQLLPSRIQTQITLGVIALASVISIRFAAGVIDSNSLIIQVFATLAWAGVVYLILNCLNTITELSRSTVRVCIFTAASVIVIHSMIEVTGTWYVSGMLWALIVGLSSTQSIEKSISTTLGRYMSILVCLTLFVVGTLFALRVSTLSAWEKELELASNAAGDIAFIRSKLDELEFSNRPNVLLEEISTELSFILDASVEPTIDSVINALNSVEFNARIKAAEHLIHATTLYSTHSPTYIAASEQLLWLSARQAADGNTEESEKLWIQIISILETGAQMSELSSAYRWLGSVLVGRAETYIDDPRRESWLVEAQSAYEKAFERSPHSVQLAVRLMDLADERNNLEQSRTWALIAQKLHKESRLDPLRGLNESDLLRVRAKSLD
ncbi:MAG: O-antigen ligase family protein [Phycisphaerales bacterium]|nr:O-antigen ligase family protein [Phycisphaerales bacterium]